MQTDVLCLRDIDQQALVNLLARYTLTLVEVPENLPIPGSFWQENEAGIISQTLYARPTTPIHSILHEGCHTICMDSQRRAVLHTDAGGDYAEEDAVCYLQILLADLIPKVGRQQMWQDMDSWGYTFRLGSAQRWFEADAEDARSWLIEHNLLTSSDELVFQLRTFISATKKH